VVNVVSCLGCRLLLKEHGDTLFEKTPPLLTWKFIVGIVAFLDEMGMEHHVNKYFFDLNVTCRFFSLRVECIICLCRVFNVDSKPGFIFYVRYIVTNLFMCIVVSTWL